MITIRASELGSCIKAQVAVHLGYDKLPVPERMQAAYDRGNEHEEIVLDAMRRLGYNVTHEQHEVELVCRHGIIVGHLDGAILDKSIPTPAVVEAKAPAAWAKFRDAYLRNDWSDPLAHRYAWQISTYMWGLDPNASVEALIVCIEDGEFKSFVIEVPPFDYPDLNVRVSDIANQVAAGVVPAACTSNDYPCPVAYLHEQAEDEEDFALDMYCQQREEAKAVRDEADALVKDYDAKIREHLASTDRTTGSWKVTFYEQKGSIRWDAAGLEKILGPEVHEFRTVGVPSSRMKITKRGADDD